MERIRGTSLSSTSLSLIHILKREESAYKKIPVITDFTDADGNDRMKETVQANYRRIKEEVKQIVQEELERIAGDDNLKHCLLYTST